MKLPMADGDENSFWQTCLETIIIYNLQLFQIAVLLAKAIYTRPFWLGQKECL